MLNLFRLDRDILPLAILVALYNVRLVYRLLITRHLLVLNSFPALTAQLVKANLTLRLCGRKQFDTKRNQRDLNLTGPEGRWHTEFSVKNMKQNLHGKMLFPPPVPSMQPILPTRPDSAVSHSPGPFPQVAEAPPHSGPSPSENCLVPA